MGKSEADAAGVVRLLDPPDVVRRKVARAVTDSDTGPDAVRADRAAKPGVTNLLEILAACGGVAGRADDVRRAQGGGHRRGRRGARAAAAAVRRARRGPGARRRVFAAGAARCRAVTAPVLAAAKAAIGL